MTKRFQFVFDNLELYALWILLAILGALTAFQIHAAIYWIGLLVVENPDIRPEYWSTASLIPLSRLTILALGILWLGFVIFSEGYLREGQKYNEMRPRLIRLFSWLAGLFFVGYIVLLLPA